MKNVDLVVHFAAETHVDRSILDPAPFIKTNIEGTYVLLEAARKNGDKRFHHISTDEVFGALELGSKTKFSESTLTTPIVHTLRRRHHPITSCGHIMIRLDFRLLFLIVQIITVLINFPKKLFGLSITNILEGKKVPVYGDGLYVRDWLYVLDHCEAIDLIIQKGRVGETYLIGGLTQDISNIEIVKKIIKYMNKTENDIEYVKDRPGHDRRYAIDWTKINKELGWSRSTRSMRHFKQRLNGIKKMKIGGGN